MKHDVDDDDDDVISLSRLNGRGGDDEAEEESEKGRVASEPIKRPMKGGPLFSPAFLRRGPGRHYSKEEHCRGGSWRSF